MVGDKFQQAHRACIDNAELEVLLAGKMPDDEVAAVLRHAIGCETCHVKLRQAGFGGAAAPLDAAPSSDPTVGQKTGGAASNTSTVEMATNEAANTGRPVSHTYTFLGPPRPRAIWALSANIAFYDRSAREESASSSRPKTRNCSAAWPSRCCGCASTP